MTGRDNKPDHKAAKVVAIFALIFLVIYPASYVVMRSRARPAMGALWFFLPDHRMAGTMTGLYAPLMMIDQMLTGTRLGFGGEK